jgi:glycosyltransferase involved in cell wall biosynthesis
MTTLTEDVAVLPPEARLIEIPKAATWILLGAVVHEGYKGGDGYALELDGQFRPMAATDLALASSIAASIKPGFADRVLSGRRILDIYTAAEGLTRNSIVNETHPVKRVVMLKDKGGAGYWRMVLPARYLERMLSDDRLSLIMETEEGRQRVADSFLKPDTHSSKGSIRVDVTGADVKFDYLLEYDTIFVQRLMDWESYYTLLKLKKAGKRIVYDIDDDIYSLSPDNPAFHVITRDNQQAAAACMKLADVVTTTTDELANRLMQVVDDITPEVIPNALDTDDRWLPVGQTGSPDEWKRIFWQGSSTHEKDWEVCIDAVDQIMQVHKNVRIVILGYLPKCIIYRITQPWWKNRVEHVGFSKPETYFEMIHHVRAEVAIAPLFPQPFNEGKSPIKWLEATLIGIPVVASAMEPYASVIEDGDDGVLVSPATDSWFRAIEEMLLCPVEKRREIVERARVKAACAFDIKKAVKECEKVLLPS